MDIKIPTTKWSDKFSKIQCYLWFISKRTSAVNVLPRGNRITKMRILKSPKDLYESG
jgi:hypothetical protein